jgi:hypothetical protein
MVAKVGTTRAVGALSPGQTKDMLHKTSGCTTKTGKPGEIGNLALMKKAIQRKLGIHQAAHGEVQWKVMTRIMIL